jgi:phospholipase/carboxylesterase
MHNYDIRETGRSLDKAAKALILLHGRGATAESILPLAELFTDESWYVAVPQATGYQWYPNSFMAPVADNEPWLGSALDLVQRLIDDISRTIQSDEIYIAGFSQGACLASEVVARSARKYGGIALFTGGLIGDRLDTANYKGNFDGTRIYMSNGDNDPHIPRLRSVETQKQLREMGAEVKLDIFAGREHTITPEEIEKVKSFIFKKRKLSAE